MYYDSVTVACFAVGVHTFLNLGDMTECCQVHSLGFLLTETNCLQMSHDPCYTHCYDTIPPWRSKTCKQRLVWRHTVFSSLTRMDWLGPFLANILQHLAVSSVFYSLPLWSTFPSILKYERLEKQVDSFSVRHREMRHFCREHCGESHVWWVDSNRSVNSFLLSISNLRMVKLTVHSRPKHPSGYWETSWCSLLRGC